MQSKAKTVDEYLGELPEERREALEAIRKVVRENLSKGFEEGMQYGMIGYYVPHSVYPAGYHCNPKQPLPFVALASQKNYMAMYLMCVYTDSAHEAWFREAWTQTGKKLDMGKSCVRFKRIGDVPLAVIGKAIRRVPLNKYLEHYESVIKSMGKRGGPRKTPKRKSAAPSPKSARRSAAKRVRKAAPRRPRKGVRMNYTLACGVGDGRILETTHGRRYLILTRVSRQPVCRSL